MLYRANNRYIQELLEKIENYKKAIQSYKENDLSKEYLELKQKLADVENAFKNKQEICEEIKRKNNALEKELIKINTQHGKIQEEKNSYKLQLASDRKELARVENIQKNNQIKYAELMEKYNTLQKEIFNKAEKLNQLSEENNLIKAYSNKQREDLNELENKQKTIQVQFEKLSEKYTSLQKELMMKNDELHQSKIEMNALKTKSERQSTELAEAIQEANKSKKAKLVIEENVNQLTSKLNDRMEQNHQLKDALKKAEKENERAVVTIQGLGEENNSIKAYSNKQREELNELDNKQKIMHIQFEKLSEKYTSLQNEVMKKNDELHQSKMEMNALKTKSERQSTELAEAIQEAKKSQKAKSLIEEKVNQLTRKLNDRNEQNNQLKDALKKAEKENERAVITVQDLTSYIKENSQFFQQQLKEKENETAKLKSIYQTRQNEIEKSLNDSRKKIKELESELSLVKKVKEEITDQPNIVKSDVVHPLSSIKSNDNETSNDNSAADLVKNHSTREPSVFAKLRKHSEGKGSNQNPTKHLPAGNNSIVTPNSFIGPNQQNSKPINFKDLQGAPLVLPIPPKKKMNYGRGPKFQGYLPLDSINLGFPNMDEMRERELDQSKTNNHNKESKLISDQSSTNELKFSMDEKIEKVNPVKNTTTSLEKETHQVEKSELPVPEKKEDLTSTDKEQKLNMIQSFFGKKK
ncbi:hypothetical protein ACFYKT_01480 [Cytobacillus sp. FJAT-53684]|uniref:Uncharacterized protein n=1 Tax=Cytobacillus mangrovibacter TaxID=3299024 RepID=A0ABW6JT41_9BACI